MISGLQAKNAISVSAKASGEIICVMRISPANSCSSPAYSSVSSSESLPTGKSGPSIASRNSLPSGEVEPTIEILGALRRRSGFMAGFRRGRLSLWRGRNLFYHLKKLGDGAGGGVDDRKQ